MKSIRYLKAVLTVIAVCLVWICLRDVVIVKPAHAQGTMDVNISGVGGKSILYGDSLPVKMN